MPHPVAQKIPSRQCVDSRKLEKQLQLQQQTLRCTLRSTVNGIARWTAPSFATELEQNGHRGIFMSEHVIKDIRVETIRLTMKYAYNVKEAAVLLKCERYHRRMRSLAAAHTYPYSIRQLKKSESIFEKKGDHYQS